MVIWYLEITLINPNITRIDFLPIDKYRKTNDIGQINAAGDWQLKINLNSTEIAINLDVLEPHVFGFHLCSIPYCTLLLKLKLKSRVMLHRNKESACCFLQKALRSERNQMPRVITTDRYAFTEVAIDEKIYLYYLSVTTQHWMVKYLNNIGLKEPSPDQAGHEVQSWI